MRTMLLVEEAVQVIRQTVRPLAPTVVPIEQAVGRVLAEDVRAEGDVPGFDNSSMDGYAIAGDEGKHTPDRTYRVIGEASAGRPFHGRVGPGEAVRIMTGAKLPAGAVSVIEVENVNEADGVMRFARYPQPGRHIRRAGEEFRRGSMVFERGTRLRPAHLGVLASLGRSTATVARQPRVSVVTTGSELVASGGELAEGQIFNSSAVVVPGLLQEAHAALASVQSAPDDPERMREVLQSGATSDLMVTTGGVSVGAHDLVLDVLRSLGVTFLFWKVRIKPGMPLAFGTWPDGRPVICLPGNPVSSGVTFQVFVRPTLNALEAARETSRIGSTARLEHEIRKSDGKRHFSRGIATHHEGRWTVRTTGVQSSGMLSSLAHANCLIIIPEKAERLEAGEEVEVEWL